jgi:hypothetical protein
VVGDAFFRYTTLLLSGTIPNGANVLYNSDLSSNNFAVTPNGDVSPRPLHPYLGNNYSVYFDGTGDYVTLPSNAALAVGTGDFTFETWVYPTVTIGNGIYFIIIDVNTTGMYIGYDTAGTLGIGQRNSAMNTSVSYTFSVNVWTHLAVVRSASTVNFYINGVSIGSGSNSVNYSGSATAYIGGGIGNNYTGYLSNYRILKGTALYTANFTPSTQSLTAVANTSVLICQSNRLIDNSNNNFTVTRNGDVRITDNSPFAITNTTSGSAYFDGTGDYLQVANNAAFGSLNSTAWTIEAWAYATSTASSLCIAGCTSIGASGFGIFVLSGTLYFYVDGGVSSITGATFTVNQWHHVAVVRSASGTIALFQNGVRQNTATANLANTSSPLLIGAMLTSAGWNSDFYFTGFISDVRIVKGTAIYDVTQSTLTIPTSPLTAVANTSILTCTTRAAVNNSRFIDSGPNSFAITRAGNATQGTFTPFSPTGWSNYFGGDGNYLSAAYSTDWAFSGDFSIEVWVNAQDAGRSNDAVKPGTIVSQGASGSTTNSWSFYFILTGSIITDVNFDVGPSSVLSATSQSISLNTWHHFVVCRSGSTLSIFVNGTRIATNASYSTSMSANASGTLQISRNSYGNPYQNWFKGYISNARILNGSSAYNAASSTLTVPTSPLTAITNTKLLTCQSNRFVDTNTQVAAKTITVTGAPSVQAFEPFPPGIAYSPATHGGSGYWDGSSDYISLPLNSIQLGSSDFTIEGWVYNTSTSGVPMFIHNQYTSGAATSGSFFFYFNSNFDLYIGSTVYSLAVPLPTPNAWVHVAAVRTGGTYSVYLNGQRQATRSDLSTQAVNAGGTTYAPTIGFGQGLSAAYTGYMSSFRIIIGSNGYSATGTTITVPTGPLTAVPGTRVLINFTDGAAVDASGKNVLETVGDVRATTAVTKWSGRSSYYFDGTGDYLVLPISEALNFQILTTGYTIEAWVYPLSLSGQKQIWYYQNRTNPGSGTSLHITPGTKFGFTVSTNINNSAADFSAISTVTPVINTWYHVAGVRSGNTVQLYVNGQLDGTATISGGTESFTTHSGDWKPFIGLNRAYDGTLQYYWQGYIADFRITRALRYTSNFTPPTQPFLGR